MRSVGTLIEAETAVENDKIVRDRVAEFSGGSVKTFETAASDKTPEGTGPGAP